MSEKKRWMQTGIKILMSFILNFCKTITFDRKDKPILVITKRNYELFSFEENSGNRQN